MPLYHKQCLRCGYGDDYCSSIEQRDEGLGACPVCKKKLQRVIAFNAVNCANEDAAWIRSCLEVVDKSGKDPTAVEFRKNPTRSNLAAWMRANNLRHMDPAEKATPEDRMTEREVREERAREKERVTRGMHELRLKRERIYVGGI